MGSRPPARGVDMLRNAWCAFMGTELSNALAAWTSDSTGTPFEDQTRMLGLALNHSCFPLGGHGFQEGKEQVATEAMFFCHRPQMEVLTECKRAERRIAVEGLCFSGHFPEL